MGFTAPDMIRILLALGLFCLALGANAALYLRTGGTAPAPSGDTRITLGETEISVPRSFIRDPAQIAGGRLDRLDMAVNIADFSALPPPSTTKPFAIPPDRLTVLLGSAQGQTGPAEQFQLLYARFLSKETWSNPGGLVMRRFRAGTPYEDREIYLGAGGSRLFIAICPREQQAGIEPCVTQIRVDGLDAELRFDARHLPDWRRIVGETTKRIGEWRRAGAAPALRSGL